VNFDAYFEWDEEKENSNLAKHGVPFIEAVAAFADPSRVILTDISHSHFEPRWYCMGRVGDAILTVRFTRRHGRVRIIGAGYWRKGRRIYETQNRIR
jgi:hypothetical protein